MKTFSMARRPSGLETAIAAPSISLALACLRYRSSMAMTFG